MRIDGPTAAIHADSSHFPILRVHRCTPDPGLLKRLYLQNGHFETKYKNIDYLKLEFGDQLDQLLDG